MLTLVPMAYQDQKGLVAPHFDCPDLRNATVPLMMQTLSFDADVTREYLG